VKDSQLYKRILGQSLSGVGMRQDGAVNSPVTTSTTHPGQSLHVVPPRSSAGESPAPAGAPLPCPAIALRESTVSIPGLSSEQNARIVRGVVEVAAAAATAAVHDAQRQQEQQSNVMRKLSVTEVHQIHSVPAHVPAGTDAATATEGIVAHGGHDAPNWGKAKSAIILLGATILYAIIAGESSLFQAPGILKLILYRNSGHDCRRCPGKH